MLHVKNVSNAFRCEQNTKYPTNSTLYCITITKHIDSLQQHKISIQCWPQRTICYKISISPFGNIKPYFSVCSVNQWIGFLCFPFQTGKISLLRGGSPLHNFSHFLFLTIANSFISVRIIKSKLWFHLSKTLYDWLYCNVTLFSFRFAM